MSGRARAPSRSPSTPPRTCLRDGRGERRCERTNKRAAGGQERGRTGGEVGLGEALPADLILGLNPQHVVEGGDRGDVFAALEVVEGQIPPRPLDSAAQCA